MRKLVYYFGVSIDGYIAGPAGEFDFFPVPDDLMEWIVGEYPETLPTHARSQFGLDTPNRNFDTLIMGRGTYQPALDVGITSPYRHLAQHVVSTSTTITDPEVRLIAHDPAAVIRELKKREGLSIWLCGGGKLAGALLPEIDELIVKSYPVIAGSGIPAFSGLFRPTIFTPTQVRSFSNGTTVTHYTRT
ncbi:deaminase [Acrocarpospora pleiomorpha]|uniref:Deaminase n=1 Tax=Acrocarpospora pleiomorpha TaxID=90975 RepID=A0A5M3XYC5_9ACTN|nr:dihydrofolate reductase family protein [Acrocarpospora pleiomorpha]GES24571.1 deaminase [Acrocarpospora pleiomorpha]